MNTDMKRRHSLLGPFLMIAIGCLFLLYNVRPDLPILSILAKWWPFFLIGWGLLRLIEIVFWASTGKPLPERGIGGGEWVLIVLVCIFGSSYMAANHYSGRFPNIRFADRGVEFFGESYDFPLTGQQPSSKTPRIVIDNTRGNARITGADVSEVKVTGTKTIKAFSQKEADDFNGKTPFEVVKNGDQIIIRSNGDRIKQQIMRTDLEITVPRGSIIEAKGRYGDFDMNDLTGPVEITSDNAGIRLQNIGGNVRVDLKKSDIVRATNVKGTVDIRGPHAGDIELDGIEGQTTLSGDFFGEVQFRNLAKPLKYESSRTNFRCEKVPGSLRITSGNLTGNGITGPVQLTATKSKDVQLTDFTNSLEITMERGDVELRPGKLPLSKMDVQTRNGDIEIALPPGAKFDLKGTVRKGETNNDFGDPLKSDSRQISGSNGGPSIVLGTDRGNITVRKAAPGDAAPPVPPAAPAKPSPPPGPPEKL